MEKASITLTKAHHDLAHSAIQSGEYASLSEVVRDALREWERKRQMRQMELESLREFIREGINSLDNGQTIPFDIEEIKRRGRERLASKDA